MVFITFINFLYRLIYFIEASCRNNLKNAKIPYIYMYILFLKGLTKKGECCIMNSGNKIFKQSGDKSDKKG
jgi:hypothetical protein